MSIIHTFKFLLLWSCPKKDELAFIKTDTMSKQRHDKGEVNPLKYRVLSETHLLCGQKSLFRQKHISEDALFTFC